METSEEIFHPNENKAKTLKKRYALNSPCLSDYSKKKKFNVESEEEGKVTFQKKVDTSNNENDSKEKGRERIFSLPNCMQTEGNIKINSEDNLSLNKNKYFDKNSKHFKNKITTKEQMFLDECELPTGDDYGFKQERKDSNKKYCSDMKWC